MIVTVKLLPITGMSLPAMSIIPTGIVGSSMRCSSPSKDQTTQNFEALFSFSNSKIRTSGNAVISLTNSALPNLLAAKL